jgi:vancomycin resistance protein VanJ
LAGAAAFPSGRHRLGEWADRAGDGTRLGSLGERALLCDAVAGACGAHHPDHLGLPFAHLLLGMWLMESWRSGQPSREPADLRVVHWNVGRPSARFAGIARVLREYDADVYTIAEPVPRSGKGGDWRQSFPGYAAEFAPGGLLCLVRGEISSRKIGQLGTACYYALYEARVKERDIRVLQVDLNGFPSFSRREPLRRLADMAEALRDRPLIIAGDFNTPRDSVHYEPLRKSFVDCFEKVGIGSGETWPMPLPVLSLDQVWTGWGIGPVRCRHDVSFRSDHRAVVSELRFKE